MLDGEVAPQQADALRRHLAGCAACAALHAEVERDDDCVRKGVALLDAGFPPVDLPDVTVFATRARRRRRVRLRWAAAVLLPAVAAAAAAGPAATMIRRWAATRVARGAAPALAAPDTPSRSASPNGVTFEPGAAADLDIQCGAAGGSLRVDVVAGAAVRVTEANGRLRYRLGDGRLMAVADGGPLDVRVEIPHDVRRATLRACGRTVLEVRHGVVSTAAAMVDGHYAILLP
ncbi:MAG: zf-HC2 domain-containing protein [Gemmatimonadota bacterium]|nr:zf-HC2 domain-containing protein [Gemmatimonadota bacterium]